jgi:hypothetical protein
MANSSKHTKDFPMTNSHTDLTMFTCRSVKRIREILTSAPGNPQTNFKHHNNGLADVFCKINSHSGDTDNDPHTPRSNGSFTADSYRVHNQIQSEIANDEISHC